jgi:protein-L-isoaspartate(D-aspartate) O-methyltransferase
MWAPKIEARVLQEVAPRSGEIVYEVGTGSGHFAALLAQRAAQVTSVEIHPDLAASARANLRAAGIANVEVLEGDGARSPVGSRAFDVIVLTGSTPFVPDAFFAQLKDGGRLFAVTGDAPAMKATVFHKGDRGELRAEELFETRLKPLVNAQQPSRFRF